MLRKPWLDGCWRGPAKFFITIPKHEGICHCPIRLVNIIDDIYPIIVIMGIKEERLRDGDTEGRTFPMSAANQNVAPFSAKSRLPFYVLVKSVNWNLPYLIVSWHKREPRWARDDADALVAVTVNGSRGASKLRAAFIL